ncbi:hypothetical protein ACOSQ2_003256 [Xanthoceras sorbifolium]
MAPLARFVFFPAPTLRQLEIERNGSGSTVKKINRIRVTAFFHFGMWDDNRGSRFQSLGTGRMEPNSPDGTRLVRSTDTKPRIQAQASSLIKYVSVFTKERRLIEAGKEGDEVAAALYDIGQIAKTPYYNVVEDSTWFHRGKNGRGPVVRRELRVHFAKLLLDK